MFKTYEKYIIKNFVNKFLTISLIFLSLIIILSILEEISFFKDLHTIVCITLSINVHTKTKSKKYNYALHNTTN